VNVARDRVGTNRHDRLAQRAQSRAVTATALGISVAVEAPMDQEPAQEDAQQCGPAPPPVASEEPPAACSPDAPAASADPSSPTDASEADRAAPFTGMYDAAAPTECSEDQNQSVQPQEDAAPNQSVDNSPPANQSVMPDQGENQTVDPAAVEKQQVEEEEKQKKVAACQEDIDASKRLEEEAEVAKADGNKELAESKLKEADAKKQSALDKAVDAYKIDTSKAKAVIFNRDTVGEGETSKEGTVTMGNDAFKSAAWLGSSVGHETEVHNNAQAQNDVWYTGKEGTAMQEVEAYQYELDNSKRYGTTKEDQEELGRRRQSYYNKLSPDYQAKADRRDYTMEPGDEKR
jgi:hypothetical protein